MNALINGSEKPNKEITMQQFKSTADPVEIAVRQAHTLASNFEELARWLRICAERSYHEHKQHNRAIKQNFSTGQNGWNEYEGNRNDYL